MQINAGAILSAFGTCLLAPIGDIGACSSEVRCELSSRQTNYYTSPTPRVDADFAVRVKRKGGVDYGPGKPRGLVIFNGDWQSSQMRLWQTAAITVGLAILYAPVFAPSMSPPALLAGVLAICLVFAILDGIIFALGAVFKRRPSWLTITVVNVILWLLAWLPLSRVVSFVSAR